MMLHRKSSPCTSVAEWLADLRGLCLRHCITYRLLITRESVSQHIENQEIGKGVNVELYQTHVAVLRRHLSSLGSGGPGASERWKCRLVPQ